jgi:hypothetical protein
VALYFGNPLSFTNIAVQPKTAVFRLMSDSNLDWGQNRDRVGAWMESRDIPAARLNPPHILPGANVFQVNVLVGTLGAKRFRHDRYAWFRDRADPAAHFRHTYLLFDVAQELFEEFLDQNHTLDEHDEGRQRCAAASLEPMRERTWRESRANQALVCLHAASKSEVRVVNKASSAPDWHGYRWATRLGHLTEEGECHLYPAEPDQELWYRLLPGVHALCLDTPWAEIQSVSGQLRFAELGAGSMPVDSDEGRRNRGHSQRRR